MKKIYYLAILLIGCASAQLPETTDLPTLQKISEMVAEATGEKAPKRVNELIDVYCSLCGAELPPDEFRICGE